MLSFLSILFIFFFAVKAIKDTTKESEFYEKCLAFCSTIMIGGILYAIIAGITIFTLYHLGFVMF